MLVHELIEALNSMPDGYEVRVEHADGWQVVATEVIQDTDESRYVGCPLAVVIK